MVAVNFLAAAFFLSDKRAAVKDRKRVPEKRLHLLELLGGVFVVVLLMQVARHKRQKPSYYLRTYAILALWIAALAALWFIGFIS